MVSGSFSVVLTDIDTAPVDVVVVSALLYDPALQNIIFTFRTTITYPYMINPTNALTATYVPNSHLGTANVSAVFVPSEVSLLVAKTINNCALIFVAPMRDWTS